MATSTDLDYPFTGKWMVQNSPANRVPSHGTTRLATSYAIDFVPVDDSGRTSPVTFGSLVRPEPPERFVGFGRALLAPVEGIVVAAHDSEPDHPSYRGIPSIGYALTQRRRVEAGWLAIAGNHVFIDTGGVVVVLCHLKQGSLDVQTGQYVKLGTRLARCGNSGNSTEPHVHVQAISTSDIDRADAVPVTFEGSLPSNGEVIDIAR